MQHETSSRSLTRWIMVAVFLWGTILAVGAGIYGIDAQRGGVTVAPNVVRGLIVWSCVLAFLAFWGLALRSRRSN